LVTVHDRSRPFVSHSLFKKRLSVPRYRCALTQQEIFTLMIQHAFQQRLLDDPLGTIVDYYAQHLNQNAHRFLQRMCLSADPTLRVGFSDRTLGLQIPAKQLKLGREIRKQLLKLGALKRNGREAFRGFVTVPLTEATGEQVTGIYGLRLDNKGKDQPQLTVGQGIFNAAALRNYREIIVCRDSLDAWTFCAAGHTNAVAVDGLPWSPDWLRGVERILWAPDVVPGQEFVGADWMRIHFPEGMSVNQYAQLNRHDENCLGERIRAAACIDEVRPAASDPPGEAKQQSAESPVSTPTSTSTPTASPTPVSLPPLDIQLAAEEITITIEHRRWRVRGLAQNKALGLLRVNLLLFNDHNQRLHVDSFDLYHARSRRFFLQQASEETGLVESQLRQDVGRILLELEQRQLSLQDEQTTAPAPPELTESQRAEAMEFLQDANLLERILDDFQSCGLVGERLAKLTGYLVATSRLLPKPLGLVLQSSSAAGKTSLLDAVLAFMPPESLFACSAMTGRSLYYAANLDLRHKILTVAEEEGARDAAYALKLLQSDGQLSIITTGKQAGSGRNAAQRYEVQGPVATLLTTTALQVDPELLNRCLVLSVDEAAQQTAAIQQRQREAETIDELLRREETSRIRQRHQNAQRLLRGDLQISNPYAAQLTFPAHTVRHRRDQAKYLGLIRTIAFLHQHQREVQQVTGPDVQGGGHKIEYIEVTRQDIQWANEIATAVLRTCTADELPPATQRLLHDLRRYVSEENSDNHPSRFTRRQIREASGWNTTQLRIHLERLREAEYIVAHGRTGRGKLVEYELLDESQEGVTENSLSQLIDATKLQDM
jgi:hypothetical protein